LSWAVASTMVPVVMHTPFSCKCRFTVSSIAPPSLCSSSRWQD
jgi:hypothetical protein